MTQRFTDKPYIVEDRRMMSRVKTNAITLTHMIEPGETTDGCMSCCHAPKFCPCCALCICCDDPEYIVTQREASKYIVIRENSIEWNDPSIVTAHGNCCGQSLCLYRIQDNVKTLYFDDPMVKNISNKTRMCNELRTFCCGGAGQTVRIDSNFCCGCCVRGSLPCPCVPICCPGAICPCALAYDLQVKDAEKAVYEIKMAQANAKKRMGIE